MSSFLLLLLICFIYHSGAIPVRGKKGGNVTLACEYKTREISDIRLIRHRKPVHFAVIPVCPNEEDKHRRARVCKNKACEVVVKNLIFSDAGKYILRFNYRNGLTELKYQLHIYDKVSVKIGETLKLDVLLSNADEVQHQSYIRTEWKEIWKRSHGVQNDLLNDRDGNLIISNFTPNDVGTYRVLDSEGDVLITVTVEETTRSELRNGSEQLEHWTGVAGLPVLFCWLCLF